jgi:hypothetical protein
MPTIKGRLIFILSVIHLVYLSCMPALGIIGVTMAGVPRYTIIGVIGFVPAAVFLSVVGSKIFDETSYPARLSTLAILLLAVPLEIGMACIIVEDGIWIFFAELCFVEVGGLAGGLGIAVLEELIFDRFQVFNDLFMLVLNLLVLTAVIAPFAILGIYLFMSAARENIIWLILMGSAMLFSFWDYFIILTDRDEDDWVVGRYSPLALFGLLTLIRRRWPGEKRGIHTIASVVSYDNTHVLILLGLLAFLVSCGTGMIILEGR